MQWSNAANAGFTAGTPWLKINPNYTGINVENQLQDPDSIYHYYRKLISLRGEHPAAVYGYYDLLLPQDKQIYAYTRTLARVYRLGRQPAPAILAIPDPVAEKEGAPAPGLL